MPLPSKDIPIARYEDRRRHAVADIVAGKGRNARIRENARERGSFTCIFVDEKIT